MGKLGTGIDSTMDQIADLGASKSKDPRLINFEKSNLYNHSTSTLQRDEKWTENSSTAITYDPMHTMLCRVLQKYVLTTYTYTEVKTRQSKQNAADNQNSTKWILTGCLVEQIQQTTSATECLSISCGSTSS